MSGVITSPEQQSERRPLLFLAGPIQGAPEWQAEAIQIVQAIEFEVAGEAGMGFDIANPRRSDLVSGEFNPEEFARQVEWEHAGLLASYLEGVVMFWFARERKPVAGRSYAQSTRIELGEAIAWSQFNRVPVVVGIEKGFGGARYIREMLRVRAAGKILVEDDLHATCLSAVRRMAERLVSRPKAPPRNAIEGAVLRMSETMRADMMMRSPLGGEAFEQAQSVVGPLLRAVACELSKKVDRNG